MAVEFYGVEKFLCGIVLFGNSSIVYQNNLIDSEHIVITKQYQPKQVVYFECVLIRTF